MNQYEEDIQTDIVAVFKGICAGVALYRRSFGDDDKHLCFIPLVEDDENWFVSKNGWSTGWLNDFMTQMKIAIRWLDTDKSVEKYQWGYRLK